MFFLRELIYAGAAPSYREHGRPRFKSHRQTDPAKGSSAPDTAQYSVRLTYLNYQRKRWNSIFHFLPEVKTLSDFAKIVCFSVTMEQDEINKK